jgi:hypothetical protein
VLGTHQTMVDLGVDRCVDHCVDLDKIRVMDGGVVCRKGAGGGRRWGGGGRQKGPGEVACGHFFRLLPFGRLHFPLFRAPESEFTQFHSELTVSGSVA